MKDLLLCFILLPLIVFSQCPPDGTFNSQAEIDALAIDYPDCTILNSSLVISGDDITDLSGLGQIAECNFLLIRDNLVLQNLNGLNTNLIVGNSDLYSTDVRVTSNPSLISISALSGLYMEFGAEGGFYVSGNPVLANLDGAQLISNANGALDISISNNDSLTNLEGLDNPGSNRTLSIRNNDNLIDFSGLGTISAYEGITISNNASLQSFNGANISGYDYLTIEDNPSLTNISGIDSYFFHISIQNNSSLSICNVEFVCNFIWNIGIQDDRWFPGTFTNNAPGCNTNFEVEFNCEYVTNDNCENQSLGSYNVLIPGETIVANNEFATTSSQNPTCNDVSNRKDVWFAIDSEDSVLVNISVDSGYSLQLWEGDCYQGLNPVNNGCGSNTLIGIPVTNNTLYYLQVWSDDTGRMNNATGWFELNVQDGLLSIPEDKFNEVSLYPNPASNMLNVKAENIISSISVYNLLGQQVKEFNLKTLESQIDMSGFQSGMYLVEVTIDGQKATYKIIKD